MADLGHEPSIDPPEPRELTAREQALEWTGRAAEAFANGQADVATAAAAIAQTWRTVEQTESICAELDYIYSRMGEC